MGEVNRNHAKTTKRPEAWLDAPPLGAKGSITAGPARAMIMFRMGWEVPAGKTIGKVLNEG
jgi:hypothetical protein